MNAAGGRVMNASNVVATLRTYNNEGVVKSVRRLLSLGVGMVNVITNAVEDCDSTAYWLKGFPKDQVQIHPIFRGYTWSNALNAAIFAANLQSARRVQEGLGRFEWLLNISNEALLEPRHLEAMLLASESDERIMVVGTSFAGRKNGNPFDLGPSYRHPRNTCMLVSLTRSPFLFFDPYCDQIGGNEDLEYVLRVKAAGYEVIRLDLKVPLLIGVNYNQEAKESRELGANCAIAERLRGTYLLGSLERERIEAVLAEMGL